MKMLKLAFAILLCAALPACKGFEPIPDKLVVLTFDDSVASQFTVVRPLLKQYSFGATFFISEGFGFPTNKTITLPGNKSRNSTPTASKSATTPATTWVSRKKTSRASANKLKS